MYFGLRMRSDYTHVHVYAVYRGQGVSERCLCLVFVFPVDFRSGRRASRCPRSLASRAFLPAPLAPSPSLPPADERGAQRCLALSFQGNIVVLVHGSEDAEDEENNLVGNSLGHHSDLILWVEGLATGFCKDVHGEVTHAGMSRTALPGDVSCAPAAPRDAATRTARD